MDQRIPQNRSESKSEPAARGPGAEPAPSVFAGLIAARPLPRAVTMTDMLGLVAGFAVAAYVYRGTILAVAEQPAAGRLAVALVVFAWLGTVVAGPLVLGMRRIQHGGRLRLSTGEAIWGALGLVWILVAIARGLRALDPITMTNLASHAAALVAGLAPVLVVIVWHLERSRARPSGPFSWCHRVGIICAATWPASWTLAAFLLGV